MCVLVNVNTNTTLTGGIGLSVPDLVEVDPAGLGLVVLDAGLVPAGLLGGKGKVPVALLGIVDDPRRPGDLEGD